MDAAAALADLVEISSEVVAVVILEEDGSLLGSTASDTERARRFARSAARLVSGARRLASDGGLTGELHQVEVSSLAGSVFCVRDGRRTIVAMTRSDPNVGLVLYDLRRCLESLEGVEASVSDRSRARLRAPAASVLGDGDA